MTGKQLLASKTFVFSALTPKAHEQKTAVLLSVGFMVGEDDKHGGEEQLTCLSSSSQLWSAPSEGLGSHSNTDVQITPLEWSGTGERKKLQ